MNLYAVLSEPYMVTAQDFGEGTTVQEPDWICELVVARNRGQAKYLAWKSGGPAFDYYGRIDIRDMPRFSVRLRKKNVRGPARVASAEVAFEDWIDYAIFDKRWWDASRAVG